MKRAVAAVAVALAAMIGTAPTAFAHNTLISSNPANGAAVESGPSVVALTFDQPIQPGFNTVTVTGPDGTRWDKGEPEVSGNVVKAAVLPLGPAGDYQVGYRVLSADGHPVSGALTIKLTKAGNGTPAPRSDANPVDQAADSPIGNSPVWPWIVGAGVLLVVGVVLALRPAGKKR